MIRDFVVPFFRSRAHGKFVLHRTLKTTGITESMLASRLGDIERLLRGDRLAFLPSTTGVRLRITAVGTDRADCEQRIASIEQQIRTNAEKFIYGIDDEELEEIVGRLLARAHRTIGVAESCTGGMIAHKLTNVSGSSDYFERGVVAYSNKSKTDLLHVPSELIAAHGAVSKEVAEAMAHGIRTEAGTDIGVSTTGIAGPTGGTIDKPVGLVWIGYADARMSTALKFQFGGSRLGIKERAAQAAMELVRRMLLKIE